MANGDVCLFHPTLFRKESLNRQMVIPLLALNTPINKRNRVTNTIHQGERFRLIRRGTLRFTLAVRRSDNHYRFGFPYPILVNNLYRRARANFPYHYLNLYKKYTTTSTRTTKTTQPNIHFTTNNRRRHHHRNATPGDPVILVRECTPFPRNPLNLYPVMYPRRHGVARPAKIFRDGYPLK